MVDKLIRFGTTIESVNKRTTRKSGIIAKDFTIVPSQLTLRSTHWVFFVYHKFILLQSGYE